MATVGESSRSNRRLGNIIIALACCSFLLGGYASFTTVKHARCQARFDIAVASALQERALIADQDRDALGQMVSGFLAKPPEPGSALKVLRTYQATEARLAEKRASAPLPVNRC